MIFFGQVENQLVAQKADHQRYVRENEELTRRLKKFVERLDNDKSDLFQQLLEEKRPVFSDIRLCKNLEFSFGTVLPLSSSDYNATGCKRMLFPNLQKMAQGVPRPQIFCGCRGEAGETPWRRNLR